MNLRRLFVCVLLVVLSLSVVPLSAQGAAPLDLIRVGVSGPLLNLDPRLSMGAPSYQPALLVEGQLFRWDKDRKPQPDLVESYTVSTDGLTYTMKMRPNLKYSDGTPITVADVAASWDQIKGAAPVNKTLITPLPTLATPDADTLVWTLGAPQPDFLQFFCFQFLTIHPAAAWSDANYFNNPLSAGPYMLKDWTPGSPTVDMVENPNYPLGPMAIKEIQMVSVPDLTSRTLQLAQGDLDFVYDLPPNIQGVITDDVTTAPHAIGGMYHIQFNLKPSDPNSPLLNRDVREAMSLAIDRDAVSTKAFFGISKPATGFVFSGVPEAYANLPNGGKRDLDAAKALLAKTPFAAGFTFTLGVWGTRPGWLDATLVIKQNLADLGITAEIESMPDATAIAQLDSGNYQAQFSGNAGFPPIVVMGNQFLKGGAWTKWGNFDDPKIDELFPQISAATDQTKRLDLFHQMLDLAYQDLPLIPISERAVLSGTRIDPKYFQAINNGDSFYVPTLASVE